MMCSGVPGEPGGGIDSTDGVTSMRRGGSPPTSPFEDHLFWSLGKSIRGRGRGRVRRVSAGEEDFNVARVFPVASFATVENKSQPRFGT